MNPNVLFWLAVAGLIAVCTASVGARALRNFSRRDLEEVCRRSDLELFGRILRLHDHVARGVENFVVLLTTALVVAGTYWVLLTRRIALDPNWTVVAVDVLLFGVILSLALLWVPWGVARLWAEPFLYYAWPLLRGIALLMSPLIWCGRLVDVLLHRTAGRVPQVPNGEAFEQEIRTIVTEGHREGLLEEDAREMIEGVIELRDADVSQIMTPRTDVQMMHVGLPWDDMINLVVQEGHTRVPVFDKNRDDVIGILHSKDLLAELAKPPGERRRTLREILRRAYFVPETKAVHDLLQEFQRTGNHMAVVLDEYGGVAGLVTIEDVLEEIVGEIVDEYDEALVEEIRPIDDSACEVLGRAHIDEINERMGLDLPEDADYDTIGGFVFSELGRVPTVGEVVVWQEKARITVLEATRRRIERLRIDLLRESPREIPS